jgi:F-type H+-transporting ATPase subunit delta
MAGSVEKVYASALLEIAAEDGSMKELDEELDALSGIFSANPELTEALCAPTIDDDEKISLIKSIFEGRISDISLNLLCVLAEKKRSGCLPGIAQEFRNGYYDAAGIAEAEVTTAVPLKDGARDKLKAKLEKKFGKTVILKEKVDPSIIGGMIVTSGGSMMDGSVATRLENMHKQIRDMVSV